MLLARVLVGILVAPVVMVIGAVLAAVTIARWAKTGMVGAALTVSLMRGKSGREKLEDDLRDLVDRLERHTGGVN